MACGEPAQDVCEVANAEHQSCFGEPLPDYQAGVCDEDFAEGFLEAGCLSEEDVEGEVQAGGKQDLIGRAAALAAVAEGSLAPQPHSRLAAFQSAWEVGESGTVGRGVAGCIAGIYMLWGASGERRIGDIFRSPEARELMVRGNWDVDAHRALAQMEYDYWQSEREADSDFYTRVATAVSVDSRVVLQRTMGDIGSLNLLLTAADWRIPPYFNR